MRQTEADEQLGIKRVEVWCWMGEKREKEKKRVSGVQERFIWRIWMLGRRDVTRGG